MLAGGPDWQLYSRYDTWSEAGREEEKQEAKRYINGIALSSSCTRMRAIESEMRYPLLHLVMPVNEDEETMSSFISHLLHEEPRFDRISVICSESASLDVLCDLRNATKHLRTAPSPDRHGSMDPKVNLLFPTIGYFDETYSVESNLLKYVHDELSTNGPEMMRLMNGLKTSLESEQEGDVMARTNQEMSSLGYKCEDQSHIEIGRVVARNKVFIGNGFVCGEQNQRAVTINFVVHLNNLDKTNCNVQLVSTGIYSGYVSGMTPRVSWHENQSTWLGIALRLYRESSDWEDAEWDTDDASSGDGFHSGSDDDSEMGYA